MNQIDLTGKAAIVTGGARGIGFAIVERLLASGARCCLWDVDVAALAEAARALAGRGEVDSAAVDVTDSNALSEAAQALARHRGGIDILVNNAGIAGASKPSWELTPEEWRRVVEVDLTGVV